MLLLLGFLFCYFSLTTINYVPGELWEESGVFVRLWDAFLSAHPLLIHFTLLALNSFRFLPSLHHSLRLLLIVLCCADWTFH